MTAEQLAELSLGRAEEEYRLGHLTQVEYEAYRRAWADAGGSRCGYRHAIGWTTPSTDPNVERLAAELVRIAANR